MAGPVSRVPLGSGTPDDRRIGNRAEGDPKTGDHGPDLLAGATILVEDARAQRGVAPLALPNGYPPEGPAVELSPALGPAGAAPGTTATVAAVAADVGMRETNALRWYAGGLMVLLCLGLFGWTVWRGREPAPVTVRPLAAGTAAEIRVYVAGAVATPGVYRLLQGDRVDDAIRAAGGLTDDADGSRLNLAQRVRDEQRLDVPFAPPASAQAPVGPVGDGNGQNGQPAAPEAPAAGPAAAAAVEPRSTATARPAATPRPSATARAEPTPRPSATARPERPTASPQPTARPDGKVNVNTATAAQLEKLPGLGEVSARRIVEYRATNGPIRSLEQLRQAGISDALLRRAADYLVFDAPS